MPISTSKLIRNFSSNPHFKTFCVFPSEGEFPQIARSYGATVQIIPFFSLKKGIKSILVILTWFCTLLRFYYFLKKNNITIVHFSDFIDFPFYPVASLAKARSIAHLRMNIENRIQRIIFKFWAELFCSKVICISEAVKISATLSSKKSRVIYNPGPDTSLFDPAKSYPLPESMHKDKCNIITIANFRPVKGQEHFINIASRIEKQYPEKAHFVMIGDRLPAHQNYYNSLIGMINDLNISSHFSIIEKIRHEIIPQYITHSSILLHLPNYQEGFGGVILEAMIMGVPVVAFDSGGVSECFTDHQSGFIIPQFDIDAATDATLKLLKNPELHKQFSINALNEVKKFSYQKHFSEIESIYKDTL